MRTLHLIASMSILFASVLASEIREFDVKTIERLGNELMRVSQQPGKGATTAVRKRAKQTAIAALQGKLFNIRYEYVVLDDPDGSGFLVYALGQGNRPGDTVVHGHFLVTVSADASKAEHFDALSHSVLIDNRYEDSSPKGYHKVALATAQVDGTEAGRDVSLCKRSHEDAHCGRDASSWTGVVYRERKDHETK